MTIATRTDSIEENDGGGNQPPTPQPGMSTVKDTSPGGTMHQVEGGTSCSPNCTCKFPVEKLSILDSKISSSRWVVPVLPEQELECLIKAAIELCKTNSDIDSEPCQRFYREGLTVSFTKILTDDAVHSWKYNIHNCIYNNCQKLVELIVLKLGQDVIPLLDILTMVFNPCNKFHTFNSNQQSISVPVNSNIPDEEVFARPVDYYKNQRGWLVDLINLFGNMGGFQTLLERFQNKTTLTIPIIFALIRPFGQVHEYLTLPTILKYFMPILEIIPEILDNLTDDELKREAKNESKNDAIAVVIKSCKLLAARVPHQEETVKQLEIFRLKIILRLLQISSFNGKMNALNEVNKVIAGVAYYPHRHPEEEWLTPDRMAKWIKDNNVLEILLRDSLHQPQYVEKLEKILRFLIKEKCLSLADLDAVWSAQSGKHDAIVKNVHELLAKLAWDFSPVQLDHLFVCFQASWSSANRKQTEKLLELIRRLAEDDKDGVMADKVLNLFWSLAHSDDVMTDIMEQALASHLKILDYSCSQERDKQKTIWLQTCIDEFKSNPKWVVPALRQIKDIVCLYEPGGSSHAGGPTPGRAHSANNRQSIIDILIKSHSLITLVTNNLCAYMSQVRDLVRENPDINPEQYYPDGRYNHVTQVQERLSILRFLIKDGQVWLCETQARQIWTALAQEAIFLCDREACFKWFSKLMTDEPDLDPKMMKDFFEKHVLHFEPAQLTESGLKCFEKFFKSVNIGEGKLLLKVKKRSLLLNNADLIGSEYLWRVITNAGEDIAFRAIELLKEVSTHLGPQLQSSLTQFHKNFIGECLDRLRAYYDTIGVLTKQNIGGTDEESMIQHRLNTECTRMCRVLKVLHEYITECDNMYSGERKLIPLHRACRGKHLLLSVRFNQPGGRSLDDIELPTHTHDTIGSVRRALVRKIKPVLTANMKLDLYLNGDFLDTTEDRKLLSSLTHQNKLFLTGKLSPSSSSSSSHHLTSSPESNNSDSSASPSPPPPPLPPLTNTSVSSLAGGGASIKQQEATPPTVVEAESSLPGVLMSQNAVYTQFLFQIGDKAASLCDAELRDSARCILRSIPADTTTVHRIKTAFTKTPSSSQVLGGAHITSPVNEIFFSPSPSQVLYNLEVMYAMLMPAVDTLSDKSLEFQHSFLSSEHVVTVVDILTKTNFLCNTDLATKRSAYLIVLKIAKFLLTILGHIKISLLEFSRLEESDPARISELESGIVLLKQAFHQSLPACTNEFIVRNIGVKLSQVFVTSHLYSPLLVPPSSLSSTTQQCHNNSNSNNNNSTTSLSPHHALPVAMDTEINNDFVNDCDNTKGLTPTDNTTNVFQVLTSNRFNTLLTSNRQQSSLDSVTPSELFNIDTSSVMSPSQHSTTHSLSTTIVSIAPNLDTVQALLKIIWAASRGTFETKSNDLDSFTRRTRDLFDMSNACDTVNEDNSLRNVINLEPNQTKTKEIDYDDVLVCKEALELFTVCLLLNNTLLKELLKEAYFAHFLVETLLVCDEKIVRACVQEQMTLSITLAYAYNVPSEQAALVGFLQLLLPLLQSPALENRLYANSGEYFSLFCKILNFVSSSLLYVAPSSVFSASVDVEKHLTQELSVLKRLSQGVKKSGLSSTGCPVVSESAGQREVLLQGHLSIVRELVCFLPSERKTEFGITNGLVRDLINDYLFPTSKLMLKLEKTGEILFNEIAPPVCQTPDSISAGFSLLIGLCVGSVPNLKLLGSMLTDMFYPDYAEPLTEWDYLPPIGPKPSQGFVGLKNAGATCYMNSVLQQLFMVDQIRIGILGAEGSIQDDFEDISSDESDNNMTDLELSGESRREYNIEILKQIQIIFGYLEFSQLQYYIPKGLWRHFKLQGEPVNVREQQDAVEFFMNLIESLDEAMKSLDQDQIMSHTLGGLYSDQKICQECPHRYSKEEPFSVISVDIRNHCSLLDSLEQYVKGELLEGADAYMCDKCDKKVVTVKRLCVKKLPPILGIQLKRFEYDFERLCAIKFNDYFEFPRNLDMEPYTVKGLAKIEGEMIEDEIETEHGTPGGECTKYKLTGIVVHSGQASGGHYYSYILHRGPNNQCKWYKFDDGDVSECKMDDEEEMKAQCFGGDYVGEIYDHMLKRVSVRKQKRWWNAYMLFYTRHDVLEQRDKTGLIISDMQNLTLDQSLLKLPLAIERSVWRQNIKFIHDRNQFSVEYFNFIKQLATCNIGPAQSHNSDKMTQGSEALSLITVQLVSKFLFSIGFHTKKSLRGLASDWFECLSFHFRCYRAVRCWFAYHILFKHPHRFCEYLLASPIPEVRSVFMKILVYLSHFSLGDDLPSHLLVPPPPLSLSLAPEPMKPSMSDMLLLYVLSLCNKELSEYGKHCPHYFTLFHMYASLGRREKAQLLKLNVPTLFILIALDEGPGPPIKYQCPELSKLHSVVLLLVRCCDVAFKCMSVCPGSPVLRNPYLEDLDEGQQGGGGYLQPLDVNTSDLLFNRNHYIKKLIEDSQISEDCLKFLQFLSWENPQMSKTVISDLLQQIAFAYCHELRHFFDLLLGLLIMQDSWQTQRILLAMKGIDDERDGLFDTIQKSKSHYQKRAYQCIKCLVALYSKCPLAYDILLKEDDLKKKWILAAHWLRKELERRPSAQYTQYSYSNWSPPAIQSNETANGYFLERSNSAKKVLEAAFVLCPSEEVSTERGVVTSGGGGGVDTSDVSSDEEADEDSTGEDMDTSETWTSPSHPGQGGENWDKTGRYIPLKWGSSSSPGQGTSSVGVGGGGSGAPRTRTLSSVSKLGKIVLKKDVSVSPGVNTMTGSSVKSTSSFLDKLYQYDRDLPPPAGTPSPSTSSLPPTTLKPGGGGSSPLLPYEIETNTLGHTEDTPYEVESEDIMYNNSTNSPATVTPYDTEPVDPTDVNLPHRTSLEVDTIPSIDPPSDDVMLPESTAPTDLVSADISLPQGSSLPRSSPIEGSVKSLPPTATDSEDYLPPPPPLVDNTHPSSLSIPASPPPPPPSSSSSSPSS